MSKEEFLSAVSYPSLPDATQTSASATTVTTTTFTPQIYSKSNLNDTFSASNHSVPAQSMGVYQVSQCAICSNNMQVDSQSKRPFVFLSCGHFMHIKCFADNLTKTPLSVDCNESFGGPKTCVNCLSRIPLGFQSDALNDREQILKDFRAGYSGKYFAYNGPEDDEPLNPEQIRSILGVKVGWLVSDKTDYSLYGRSAGCKKPDELIAELRQRNRTLEDIFVLPKVNVHSLYKLGITTMEDLIKLGFNAATHGSNAYRTSCPYWMLCDLFNFDKDYIFKHITADALLAHGYKPKELWLCNVSMQSLVENKLTKKGFCNYKANPVEIVKFLDLTHVHLNQLGVTRRDVSVDWNNAACTDPKIKAILDSLQK